MHGAFALQNPKLVADHTRFTHYFGGDKPDIQYTHFKGMMGAVNNAAYNIEFECSGTGGACKAAGS